MAEETNFSQGEAEEVKYQERKRLLFFGLPWTFTKYTISQDMITVDEGLIKVEENDCYMYKVQDVKLTATLPERIFGLGTIICYTGDVTDKELRLSHIKHAKEIKNYLLKASEAAAHQETHIKHADIGAGIADDVDCRKSRLLLQGAGVRAGKGRHARSGYVSRFACTRMRSKSRPAPSQNGA